MTRNANPRTIVGIYRARPAVRSTQLGPAHSGGSRASYRSRHAPHARGEQLGSVRSRRRGARRRHATPWQRRAAPRAAAAQAARRSSAFTRSRVAGSTLCVMSSARVVRAPATATISPRMFENSGVSPRNSARAPDCQRPAGSSRPDRTDPRKSGLEAPERASRCCCDHSAAWFR